MKYDLPQISEEEFDRFHAFVQSVFDQGRQRFSPELQRITTVNEGFHPEHAAYLKSTDSLAVTMENRGEHQEKFSIWVNPAYKEPSFRFYTTLAHELTHGYAGLKYGHNSHWRRWFYRVLWHLDRSAMIPASEEPLRLVCYGMGLQYNTVSSSQELYLVDEAFAKAEEEHPQVEDNFWERTVSA